MTARHLMHFKVSACGLSDMGLVRQNNEDVWAELSELKAYILADGMGGHQAGEIAAREAVDALCRLLKKSFKNKVKTPEESISSIKSAFELVNTHVYKMGRANPELKGMGTTLCALYLHGDGVIVAHVGDSRIYRMREGKLTQLTKDHSLIRELVELGQVSELQASDFIYKNIITRAIGTEPVVEPTVQFLEHAIGDTYILCSDGLSDLLSLNEMETIIKKEPLLSQAAKELVELAKIKGGHDNVTLVMVRLDESDEQDKEGKNLS